MTSLEKKLGMCVISVALGACNTLQLQKNDAQSVQMAERLREARSSLEAEPQLPSVAKRLLREANEKFDRGELITPSDDNAYIRYHAVLKFMPSNREAQAGLDAILVNEHSKIQALLERSRLRAAKKQIQRLRTFFPETELIHSLEKDFKLVQRAMAQTREQAESVSNRVVSMQDEEFERVALEINLLSRRDQSIVDTLQSVAQRLENSNEFLLIYARNDAEGRWIYKQMRDAVTGYRIRGDIRISATPHLKIMKL